MTRTRFGLAVLDMAGTTVADDGAVEDAFREALDVISASPTGSSAELALADPAAFIRQTMGQSKISVFTELFGGDVVVAEAANHAFETAFDRAIDLGDVTPLPGAVAAIRALQGAGIKVCLITGLSPASRDRIIVANKWEHLPDLVLSPIDAGRGRPWPDMVLTAVLRLAIDDVARVAVAGDSASDLEAGTRAGASVVAGVLSGVQSRQELEAAPHTHIIDSIADLPALLLG
jgi:phosphoglycolate phosphatase